MSFYSKLNPNREFSEYIPRTPESIRVEKRIELLHSSTTKSNSTLFLNDDELESNIS